MKQVADRWSARFPDKWLPAEGFPSTVPESCVSLLIPMEHKGNVSAMLEVLRLALRFLGGGSECDIMFLRFTLEEHSAFVLVPHSMPHRSYITQSHWMLHHITIYTRCCRHA